MKTKKLKLLVFLALASVVFITGCKKDNYEAKVNVCPLVVSTIPTDKAINVPLNQVVSATFNEKMNPATITQASFTLKGLTSVLGTVSYTDTTASFTPSSALTPNTTYTATITTGAKSVSGTPLENDYVWTFRTKALGNPSDTSAVKSPVVTPPVGGTSPVVKPPVVVPPVVTPRKQ